MILIDVLIDICGYTMYFVWQFIIIQQHPNFLSSLIFQTNSRTNLLKLKYTSDDKLVNVNLFLQASFLIEVSFVF